tara:strand:- start:944 stop:1105 length:162 start_codon:yes stop_codon:yes gene_type:complete
MDSLCSLNVCFLRLDIFTIRENQVPGAGGEVLFTDAISDHAKNNMVIGFKFTG